MEAIMLTPPSFDLKTAFEGSHFDRPRPFEIQNSNRMIDAAEHRYLLSLKVADASGEAWLNLFNQEVRSRGAAQCHGY